MLKSTYKAVVPESSLPPGWSEYKAPTGHSYYYNAETKQSTYTRPTELAPVPLNRVYGAASDLARPPINTSFAESAEGHNARQFAQSVRGSFRGGRSYQDRSRRQLREDRPKHKLAIPGCEPWLLVKTKLGRRFVYNPEKQESFWKFPQDVMLAVLEMDRRDKEQREHRDREELEVQSKGDVHMNIPEANSVDRTESTHVEPELRNTDESDSYEEVEVTDDEDGNDFGGPSKRPKTEQEGPIEFNEEDIAFQLAQMGQEYGLEPEEYDEDNPDYDAGLSLTEAESTSLFRDLLDDFHINPYTTWEKIIEEAIIIDDDRYVALPNASARKQAFSDWSRDRIHDLQERRKKEEKKDPKIAYLRFLHQHATPKLYWPEFKRKFKKEPEMKDTHLAERDKEKLYRDHIAMLRRPESTKKSNLSALLKEFPITALNGETTLETLPSALLTDLKFISLPAGTRDPIVEAYIATLASAPVAPSELPVEEQAALRKKNEEQQRKLETALAERERRVQEEKRKQKGALRHGKELLRGEEAEVGLAMRVLGRNGLRAYMEDGTQEEDLEQKVAGDSAVGR